MSTTGKANILLIIADDLARENVLVTDRSPQRMLYVMTGDIGGPMILGELDVLSILLRNGLWFNQAWAQPACSTTRGSLYTGTWPWRNGVGSPSGPTLDPALVTALPQLLGPEGYHCGIFGKWHLGKDAGFRPPDHGWDRHVGTLLGVINPPQGVSPCGLANADYENWCKEDSLDYANPVVSSVYATRDTIDEALAWIAGLPANDPWFATIAFHTPHDPFHEPPAGYQLPRNATPSDDDEMFNAMSQNMDANIGRLLGAIGLAGGGIAPDQLENTVIVFIGDNGAHWDIATEEAKTEIYEGGVRVPLIVADGQAVHQAITGSAAPVPRFLEPGKLNRSSPRLVHAVDLYATITEVAGVTAALPSPLDSVSLWRFPSQPGAQPPTRAFNFSQYYTSSVQRATIRNLDYKLNYEHPDQWTLFAYWGHEVPGLEDGTSADLFPQALADVQAGVSNEEADHLDALLDELVGSGDYELDAAGTTFPDPR